MAHLQDAGINKTQKKVIDMDSQERNQSYSRHYSAAKAIAPRKLKQICILRSRTHEARTLKAGYAPETVNID